MSTSAGAPAHDNVGVAFYRVIKNGRILADVGRVDCGPIATTSPGTGTLRYSVTAFDAAGNASKPGSKEDVFAIGPAGVA